MSTDAGMEADASPPVDLTAPVYDPKRVLDIQIEMLPTEWDQLRLQSRSIFDVLGASCLTAPPERPFTYFRASVRIDGVRVDDVGVRKKGFFGSLSETKPSLKVKFSEYDREQRFSGLKRLTLNNAISDASYVKQCIGYQLFADAGVPAPRCNFATVSVNGESLGLFVNVEGIKKQFVGRHFADNSGNLYEGALSDFRAGWVETFQRKTNKIDTDRSDIGSMVDVLALPDAELPAALAERIDEDKFLSFWAMELILMHADGYARNTNNFYLYQDPTSGKMRFIPWGIDSILFDDQALPWEDAAPPTAVWAEGVLTRRLYNMPASRARYFDRVQQLLDEVWDETAILAEIDRMRGLALPKVKPGERATVDAEIDKVRRFVRGRRGRIETALAAQEPNWGNALRDPWCIDEIGSITATFSTTWGTLGSNDPFADGSGTMQVTLDTTAVGVTQVGSTSGPDEETAKPALQVVSWTDTNEALVAALVVLPPLFVADSSAPVDWISVTGYLFKITFPPMAMPLVETVGLLGDGVLTLSAAATTDAAPVVGSLTATVYEPFF